MPRNTKSLQNHYGTRETRHADNDPWIQKNFTQDNEDYSANSAQYNDSTETLFYARDRHLTPKRHDGPAQYHQSNYSEGGHGRKISTGRDCSRGEERHNEIAPDGHREVSNPNHDFNYHHNTENHETLEHEAYLRNHHYREY